MKNKVLGHLLYFSLANLLIDPEAFEKACALLGHGFITSGGLSGREAFRKTMDGMKRSEGAALYFQPAGKYYELVEETRNQSRVNRQVVANAAYNKAANALELHARQSRPNAPLVCLRRRRIPFTACRASPEQSRRRKRRCPIWIP